MNDLLYKNALFFKKEILPYTFLLEGKDFILIVKSNEQDFAHLVGKQHSKNLAVAQMKTKEFLDKALNKEVAYNDLIDFDIQFYKNEYNWIETKNNLFIELFSSFVNDTQLKIYKKNGKENYTDIDMDYFHQKDTVNISVLGIIGNTTKNQFSFNSILGNDEENLQNRFGKRKPIFIKTTHKVINKDLEKELLRLNLKVKISPRNIFFDVKNNRNNSRDFISNYDRKIINKLLKNNLRIDKGENGRKSIKIIKGEEVFEKGIKLDLKELNTNEEIAKYINNTYK